MSLSIMPQNSTVSNIDLQQSSEYSTRKQSVSETNDTQSLGDRHNLLPFDPIAQRFVAPFTGNLYQWIYKNESGWHTENRYPLSPCLLYEKWRSLNEIVGVRQGNQTGYLLIDIDTDSPHHPHNDEHGLSKIVWVLESIGLVRYILVRSSTSMGLHIYCPLPKQVNSFKLACAVHEVIDKASLKIEKGSLEIFPNCRAFNSEFNGHRLPLQEGSAILDHDLETFSQSPEVFMNIWETAAVAQDMKLLEKAIAKAKKPSNKYQDPNQARGKAAKYKSDLLNVIRTGWIGKGCTQSMLNAIAQFHYIFDGITDEGELTAAIVATTKNCNGFHEHSKHVHEIEKLSRNWAKWIIKSEKYYPYGEREGGAKVDTPNQDKKPKIIDRILMAIQQIGDRVFDKVRDAIAAIRAIAKCSPTTLYEPEIKVLWQPLLKNCNSASSNDLSDLIEPESVQPEKTQILESFAESHVTVLTPNELFLSEFSEKKSQAQAPIPYSEVSKFSNENLEPIQDIVYTEIMSFEQQIAIANICPTLRSPQPQNFRLPKEPLRQNPSTLENIRAAVEANPSCAGMRLAMLQAKLCLPALTATERSQTEDAIAWLESLKPS